MNKYEALQRLIDYQNKRRTFRERAMNYYRTFRKRGNTTMDHMMWVRWVLFG